MRHQDTDCYGDICLMDGNHYVASVIGKSVSRKIWGTYFPRKFYPTEQYFLGSTVRLDRNTCPTLEKSVLGVTCRKMCPH